MVEQRLQVAQHLRRALGEREDPVDVVGPRQAQVVAGDPLRLVGEQALGLVPEQALDVHHVLGSLVVVGCRRRAWPGVDPVVRLRHKGSGAAGTPRPCRRSGGAVPGEHRRPPRRVDVGPRDVAVVVGEHPVVHHPAPQRRHVRRCRSSARSPTAAAVPRRSGAATGSGGWGWRGDRSGARGGTAAGSRRGCCCSSCARAGSARSARWPPAGAAARSARCS